MKDATNSGGVTTSISLEAALEFGPEAWDRIVLTHPFPSVFMSWAWHQAWLQGAPTADRESAFVLTDGSRASGTPPSIILPLAQKKMILHRLRVLAMGWCAADVGTPDHLDIPASENADHGAVATSLLERSWDMLILTNLEEEFPRSRELIGALEARGCRTTLERLWPCAQIHLPHSWESYLSALSGKRRYRIRRDERDLRSDHHVAVREYGIPGFDEGWKHLNRLHAARWGGSESFGEARLSKVYETFARILAEQNRLGLMGLEVDGEVVAIDFWAEFGGTMFGLQSGRDPRWERSSVGRVLRGLGIKRAIESGLRTADFSRGVEPYKREWCPEERWCFEARVFRNTWRGVLLRAWHGAAVGARPLRSRLASLRRRLSK